MGNDVGNDDGVALNKKAAKAAFLWDESYIQDCLHAVFFAEFINATSSV